MKSAHRIILPSVLTLALTGAIIAQDRGRGSDRGERPDRPPLPPIIAALDADQDGEISSDEIENAAAALRTLDKNGDGKLTREEIGPRPPHRGRNDRHGPPPRDEDGGFGRPPRI